MNKTDLVSSEVNCFTKKIDEAGSYVTSKFQFSVPSTLNQDFQSYDTCEAIPILKRSRSNPIGMEDSDEEDIEVPCFSSLGHQNLDDLAYDSDGDIDVPRHNRVRSEQHLVIEHRQHTSLGEVGLQVWRGSLLLADYILHHHHEFNGKTVVEVGSGTGLASIIASYCGARTTATDIDNCDIMDLIQRNCRANSELVKESITVRPLDFGDNLEKLDFIDNIDTIIAGDIIYDNGITEKFVEFLCRLKLKVDRSVSVIVAMEKRYDIRMEL